MNFVYDDGGRAKSGYKGHTGDCGVRAVAILTGLPYQQVYETINGMAKTKKHKRGESNARTGVARKLMHEYLAALGFKWVATMGIGTGCMVHVRKAELPMGKVMLNLSRHYATVIDGVLHDTYDSSRNGRRCVYGYWHKE